MQRSGTRWYFNMLNDLLVETGHTSAREVREKFGLEAVFLPPATHLARPSPRNLRRIDEVARQGATFAIHTHRGATPALRRLLETGRFKANYVCRDLRDVMISGLDRGRFMRENGETKGRYLLGVGPYRSFARLHTVRGAALWAKWQLMHRWRQWMSVPGLLVTRYEDVVADTMGQMRRTADALGIDVTDEQIDRVVAAYQPQRGGKQHVSFVKGVAGRYREVLTPKEQAMCERVLRPYLLRMGYLDGAS